VDKQTKDTIKGIVNQLNQTGLIEPSAFLGFDACIDIIVRIVKGKDKNEVSEYFSESSQFGEFLINLNDKSAGIELQTKLMKPGGNMVITANALGKLGVKTECMGTFGLPEILPIFRTMSENCSLYTIGDTISATALEFDNSKVIMFDPGPYNNLTWEDIKDIIGIEKIKQLLKGKQLVSFLNWSEIENSSQIWDGFLKDVLPYVKPEGHLPHFFSDLSDCSRKSTHDIQLAVNLLGRLRNYYIVTLSLNQNESALLAKALDIEDHNSDEEFIKKLYRVTNTDILVIHRTKDALAYNGIDYETSDTFFCKEPKILTGGGDNFNAGFCYALFHKLNLAQSLLVANAVSGSYVKTGISPDVNQLVDFLEQESR
jgi:sugar/nucleoside kinase (ribokinase family)